jgi:hypothetical protein
VNCSISCLKIIQGRYFTSDNEPGGIENATHNTLERKPGHGGDKYPAFPPVVLWVAFSAGLIIITRAVNNYDFF